MIDPATALAFSVFENRGVFALLIGSGVSRASEIPTGWEIIIDLTRRVAMLEGVEEQADWTAWYRTRFNDEPNYSTLLDALSHSRDERRSILHRYIEPTNQDIEESRKVPTQGHHAIAELVRDGYLKVIITTNFDRLLENALREQGVEPTVIGSDDDLSGAVPLIHSRCYLVKLHGDYLDTRIRNTDKELEGYSDAINGLLDRIFDDYGLLVCGWSADWDHALRAALTRAPNRRYPLYWASRGSPSGEAERLIQHRRGIVVSIADADSFFIELQQKIAGQEILHSSNPRSLALLIAMAKKYLGRPEYRISLHGLVNEEAKRLQRILLEPELGTVGQWSPAEFGRRVARLEAASEPLVQLFAILGRWGGDAEQHLCSDIIASFGRKRVLGGLVIFNSMRTYPAVLLLYAFGLGALQAKKFRTLFAWHSTPLRQDNIQQSASAIETLFLWDWEGNDEGAWRSLEGLDRRKTPLSDHLYTYLSKKLSDLTIDTDEFELLFERFELTASLANATIAHSEDDLQQALDSGSGRGYCRIPVGRMGWHYQSWQTLSSELDLPNVSRELLAAGFAKGKEKHLKLALDNIARVVKRVGW